MLQGDYDQFEGILRQLSEAFGKKLTNDATQAYWRALKDLTLPVVTRQAESHLRYGKFFPKPAELRPKDAPAEKKPDPDFDAAVAMNVRNWNERLQRDPLNARWGILHAYVARIEVLDPSSTVYAERMNFARECCKRLMGECDLAYVGSDLHRIQTVSRLLGPTVMKQAIDACKQKNQPSAA